MERTAAGITKGKTVEGFVLLFVLASPLLWLIAKLCYNPKTGSYRYSPPPITPLPPKPVVILTKAQQHQREHNAWLKDFRAAEVAATFHTR